MRSMIVLEATVQTLMFRDRGYDPFLFRLTNHPILSSDANNITAHHDALVVRSMGGQYNLI